MKKSKKSFVTYTLRGDRAFLGMNPIIAITEGSERRICENCINRCVITSPGNSIVGRFHNMTDCSKVEAKKAFGAGEGVIMPKMLEGNQIGNFCKFFEFASQSSDTGKPDFSEGSSATKKTAYVFVKEEDEPVLFVAPAGGKFYYPADYKIPKKEMKGDMLKFFSVQQAIDAGFVSIF
jgi:hypothetical protein